MNTPIAIVALAGAAWSLAAQSCCQRKACENIRFLNAQIGMNYEMCCQKPESERSACLTESQNKANTTLGLILTAKQACDNGDDALVRDTIKQIRDLWLPKIIPSASGRVENQMVAFGLKDWLDLNATLARPGENGCTPVTLAIVGDGIVNPEATGPAAEALTSATSAAGTVAAVVTTTAPEPYTACTFELPPGTTFDMRFGDEWSGISLTGSLAIAQTGQFPASGNAAVGVPTTVDFTMNHLGVKAHLNLDKTSPYNKLTVGPNGQGTLGMALTLTSNSSVLAGFVQVGGTIYFSLPVTMSDDWTKLTITTDPSVPGETYTPTNPVALAAADKPPQITIPTDPCTDTNGNGIRDGADAVIHAINNPLGCQAVAQH